MCRIDTKHLCAWHGNGFISRCSSAPAAPIFCQVSKVHSLGSWRWYVQHAPTPALTYPRIGRSALPQTGMLLDCIQFHTTDNTCRYIYNLFIAIDACFRLKRRLVSSEKKDPGLGTGLAFFVEDTAYRKFLLTATDQTEISTCTGLSALNHANTKFSAGYATTGGGIGCCTRHELIEPGGVGDLQKGER